FPTEPTMLVLLTGSFRAGGPLPPCGSGVLQASKRLKGPAPPVLGCRFPRLVRAADADDLGVRQRGFEVLQRSREILGLKAIPPAVVVGPVEDVPRQRLALPFRKIRRRFEQVDRVVVSPLVEVGLGQQDDDMGPPEPVGR